MANDEAPSGFLSRWSRRKAEVREGRASDEPSPPPRAAPAVNLTPAPAAVSPQPSVLLKEGESKDGAPPASLPTLDEAQQLTPESDFKGFMARGVAPDVKNAAMKKLFADPHFNVMDGLDIYIDDYSQPDPLPMAMLRQMASAKTLNLFDDEPDVSAADADTSAPEAPAEEEPKST